MIFFSSFNNTNLSHSNFSANGLVSTPTLLLKICIIFYGISRGNWYLCPLTLGKLVNMALFFPLAPLATVAFWMRLPFHQTKGELFLIL